jgi:hypothetical protein
MVTMDECFWNLVGVMSVSGYEIMLYSTFVVSVLVESDIYRMFVRTVWLVLLHVPCIPRQGQYER